MMTSPRVGTWSSGPRIDWNILCLWLLLMSIGLIMVASASVAFAAVTYHDAWYFTKRHATYLTMGIVLALFVVCIPMSIWERYSRPFLLCTLILLALVLLPGVGKKVNGSQRWLSLGLVSMQVSEVAKLCAVIFFASFFARRHQELRVGWSGFITPLGVVLVMAGLLLAEPDFGSTVVLCGTVFAMMFVAGVRVWPFLWLLVMGFTGLGAVAYFSPYRMQRLITFLDPWADQFNTGYQLTQSLIGFGRGEWFGLGLGNSMQKLFFLPEAHTDFIFAIIAEEFGLVGAVSLLIIFALLIVRIFLLAKQNLAAGRVFPALATFGIAILFCFQVFINAGVASGLLPTKGLTLPFISYGGSSLLINSVLMAFVLRAQWELRSFSTAKFAAPRATRKARMVPEVAA